MIINSNSYFSNDMNKKGKNTDFLKFLEKKCEGLENSLCINYINNISRKLDSIENNYLNHTLNNNFPAKNKNATGNKPKSDKDKKFSLNFITKNENSTDIIRNKIEENYMLLDELEKTNRPIFTKSTEIDNSVYVEDKIKEMDDKLSSMFRTENARILVEKNIKSISPDKPESTETEIDFNNIKIDKQNDKERKIQELYERLNSTEKKIKDIAGSLLRNF